MLHHFRPDEVVEAVCRIKVVLKVNRGSSLNRLDFGSIQTKLHIRLPPALRHQRLFSRRQTLGLDGH